MGANARVLVVEDEPDILSLVLRHLRANDFVPNGFTSSLDALEEFEGDPKRYSVVLTDVMMPNMSGVELARQMLKMNPTLKVILMTACENLGEFGDLPVMSLEDIIHKPFKLTEICNRVKKITRAA